MSLQILARNRRVEEWRRLVARRAAGRDVMNDADDREPVANAAARDAKPLPDGFARLPMTPREAFVDNHFARVAQRVPDGAALDDSRAEQAKVIGHNARNVDEGGGASRRSRIALDLQRADAEIAIGRE